MSTFPLNLPLLFGQAQEGGQGAAAPAAGTGSSIPVMLITFAAIIGIFYFLVIRPQNRKQKEAQKMLQSLRKNDRVATVGGIRGTIVSVKDDTVVIRVDDNVKMEFSKSAVSQVIERREEPEPAKESKE